MGPKWAGFSCSEQGRKCTAGQLGEVQLGHGAGMGSGEGTGAVRPPQVNEDKRNDCPSLGQAVVRV